MSRRMTLAGSPAPCSWKTTSSRRSTPPARAPIPCHAGRKRASVSGGTDSTSRRSAASERLRSMRNTSGWQCSRPRIDGRNSTAVTAPPATSSEIAKAGQQGVGLDGIARESLRKQDLQFQLNCGDGGGVEELAQVLAAQQLGHQRAIQSPRLDAALGQRRLALVHELSHIREQEG